MESMENITRTLWLVSSLYREAEDAKEALDKAAEDDELLQRTKEHVSRVNEALEKMDSQDADFIKNRILSGDAFKGVCYGDALKLTEEEKAACDTFARLYYTE